MIGRIVLALVMVLPGCGPSGPGALEPVAEPAAAPPPSRAPAATPPPLLEDEEGVLGGPDDETAFEYEPEHGDPATEAIGDAVRLEGIAEVPHVPALVPYLQSRRARVQGIGPEGAPILIITRLAEVAQAYGVRAPLAARRQLTFGDEPVVQASFVPGTTTSLVYRSDVGGDETYQIYRLDRGSEPVLLTDGRSRHGSFVWSSGGDRIAYTANVRSPADADLYLNDITQPSSGERVLDLEGSWVPVAWSSNGKLLLRHYTSFTRSRFHLADPSLGRMRPVAGGGGETAWVKARFGPRGERLYATANLGDHVRLYEIHLSSGDRRNLTPDIPWDVEEIALSGDRRTLAFTTNEDGWSVLRLLDLGTGDSRRVERLPRGVVSSLRFARQARVLAFTLDRPTIPGDAYTYDLDTRELIRWTESEAGGLDTASFVAPEHVRFESFDGLSIPAWYYRPAGDGPFPSLIWVHGGPEEQTRPSFSPIIQYFLRELGIAVLAPNVRGSDGYGRRYVSLDDGRRREDAIRDIGALLDWIGERQELDAERVGIYGGSYGGYVVLASLVHHGDRLAAGCDMVGISNFVTFLENTREWRRDQRRAEYGDERDPEMRAFLESISPLSRASEIRTPLFVAHGANDPRVPAGEAEQIVEAVRSNGTDVWLMMALDEGHGFQKRRNRDLFYRLMTSFFARHLGGDGAG